MSNLERLYYNMEKISDDWMDSPEVRTATDRLEEALGGELYTRYEAEICDCAAENHKDGFIKGFRYAVSLLTSEKGGVA